MSETNEAVPLTEPDATTVDQASIEQERIYLRELGERSLPGRLAGYLKLSGPGWLQSAITLGGGSLASSLFLGILAGYTLMWLQPFAMILGIIMLSAIGYVTLSTGERPFQAINHHVNPVLGWSWALAVFAANIVWCLPQYSLANGVLTQNLLPGLLGADGSVLSMAASSFGEGSWMASNAGKLLVAVTLLVLATIITWSYDRGGVGLRLYETMLKLMVAAVVLCFFGVVITMSLEGSIPWGDIGRGMIPDFGQFFRPASTFLPFLDSIKDEAARLYWSGVIVAKQQDVMISAAATAVGINMTFLFPYSLLRRGWSKEYRGLAIFDLSTGMFIPYVLATGCVVIAAAAQFHTKITDNFTINEASGEIVVPGEFEKDYNGLVAAREKSVDKAEHPVTLDEKKVAAMLINRKAGHLSQSLTELTGPFVANIMFGLGVLAMTLSTISLLMLISGFVVSEMLGVEAGGWVHRVGTLLAGIGGTFGPFVWGDIGFYLAVPTSVVGFMLLPFAYITFALLMNQQSLMGKERPQGMKRVVWNLLMFTAASIATVGSIYLIWKKTGMTGMYAVGGLTAAAIVVHFVRAKD